MKHLHLLDHLEFRDGTPHAEPLLVNKHVRILNWTLKPGQALGEHNVPDSPLYIVVLQGRGMFAGGDRSEAEYGSGSLLLIEQGESHSVRAMDAELVFVSFMHGSEAMRPEQVGGEIGRKAS